MPVEQPFIIDIDLESVRRVRKTNQGDEFIEDRDTSRFVSELSKTIPFDTGLLPSGTLSIRQAGANTQIVVVNPPGKYLVIWGAHEGSVDAKTYHLAMPYTIMIGEYRNGEFLGARMFYSPVPPTHLDIPLYHVNLPNINCRGYRGTGVGWVCLYHRDDTTNMTIAEKAAYVGLRCSGNEAYNDGNMSETDGPRFYADNNMPVYTYDPARWEKKSETDGIDWVLDADNWIPILVQGPDNQTQHHPGGKPLTLRDAMYGRASFYYNDDMQRLVRTANLNELAVSTKDFYDQIMMPAFNAAARIAVAEVPKVAPDPTDAPVVHGSSLELPGMTVPLYSPLDVLNSMASPNKAWRVSMMSRKSPKTKREYLLTSMVETGTHANASCLVTEVYEDGTLLAKMVATSPLENAVIDNQVNPVVVDMGDVGLILSQAHANGATTWAGPPSAPGDGSWFSSSLPTHFDTLTVTSVPTAPTPVAEGESANEHLCTNCGYEAEEGEKLNRWYYATPDGAMGSWPYAYFCDDCPDHLEFCEICGVLMIDFYNSTVEHPSSTCHSCASS